MRSPREKVPLNEEAGHTGPVRGEPAKLPVILFIGFGNSLRGDDAAGLYAARELRHLGFRTVEAAQLTPELAETLSGAAVVAFLDASLELGPGEVRRTILRENVPSLFDHHFDPSSLLRLTHTVYGRVPKALLLEVGVESCELGEGLTPSVSRGIAAMVDYCKSLSSEPVMEL